MKKSKIKLNENQMSNNEGNNVFEEFIKTNDEINRLKKQIQELQKVLKTQKQKVEKELETRGVDTVTVNG